MSLVSTSRRPAMAFIFITLLLAVLGIGLVIPVLPGLVVQFEGGRVADGSHAYGWIVGVFALMQFIGSPFLGALSDHYGRRRVLLIALAGSSIDYLIMANAPSLGWLFVARAIAGLTSGVMATSNAYVADIIPPEKRAQSFGLLGAAFGIGFILGPALGGLLGHISLRAPFWAAAACSAANWLYGAFVLPESLKPENRKPFSWKRANPIGSLLALRRFPSVLGLAWTYLLVSIGQMMLWSSWVLYTGYRYGWSAAQVGGSLAFVGLSAAFVQAVLVKHVIARIGERRGIVVGLSISICAYVAYGLATQGWMIYPIIACSTLAGITGPSLLAYTTRHVPPNEHGSIQGALAGLASVAGIIGPPVAAWSFGWAIDPERLFHLPGIAFFLAAAAFMIALFVALRAFSKDLVEAVSSV